MTKTRDESYVGPVQVITSVVRRRRWNPEEKRAMVQEAESPEMNVSSVARKYGIHPNQQFRWRRLMHEGALCAVKPGEEVVPATEVKALRQRIRELERLVGRKTMEVEILKEGIAIAREKTGVAKALVQGGRYPVKAITETLEVSPSNQCEQRRGDRRHRPKRYKKAEHDYYLPLIRKITDERPTYGYRRVTALLNRDLMANGHPRINHKRVYRMLKIHGLLLGQYTARPARAHDGVVMTQTGNIPWCSDVFEIICWNGKRLRVGFTMDCCDREVMSYVATTAGISGDMIKDLITEVIESPTGRVFQVQLLIS
jgi:transposase-like protein